MRTSFWLYLLESMSFMDALKVFDISKKEAQDLDFLKKKWKKLALKHHPDRGGSLEMMQKVNIAYSVLKSGKSTTGEFDSTRTSKSKEERDAEYEKRKKEKQEMNKKWYELAKIILGILKEEFDPQVFINYFNHKFNKKFNFDIKWTDLSIEKFKKRVGSVPSHIGASVVFDSSDMEISIPFKFTTSLYNLGPKTDKLDTITKKDIDSVMVSRYVFWDKKYKMGRKENDFLPINSIVDPRIAFPEKNIDKITSGSSGNKKFKKQDMLLFLKNRLNATFDLTGKGETAKVFIGDGDYYLLLYRYTMMRTAAWSIDGIYLSSVLKKRVIRGPVITAPETQETAQFFELLKDKLDKSTSEENMGKVLEQLVKEYKKKL